jgi:hypothetical protein
VNHGRSPRRKLRSERWPSSFSSSRTCWRASNRRLRLPPEPRLTEMLEGEIAPSVDVEVSGCIECIVFDYLPLTIEALQHAATVTTAQLRQDHKNHQERRR